MQIKNKNFKKKLQSTDVDFMNAYF